MKPLTSGAFSGGHSPSRLPYKHGILFKVYKFVVTLNVTKKVNKYLMCSFGAKFKMTILMLDTHAPTKQME
jgi:hypothetical protein